MNAKQRNQNRDTAHNLRLSLTKWDSRNRRLVPAVPKAKPFRYDAPFNPEFLGAQRAVAGEDY